MHCAVLLLPSSLSKPSLAVFTGCTLFTSRNIPTKCKVLYIIILTFLFQTEHSTWPKLLLPTSYVHCNCWAYCFSSLELVLFYYVFQSKVFFGQGYSFCFCFLILLVFASRQVGEQPFLEASMLAVRKSCNSNATGRHSRLLHPRDGSWTLVQSQCSQT